MCDLHFDIFICKFSEIITTMEIINIPIASY